MFLCIFNIQLYVQAPHKKSECNKTHLNLPINPSLAFMNLQTWLGQIEIGQTLIVKKQFNLSFALKPESNKGEYKQQLSQVTRITS